jgi:hypothetical protein
MAESRVPRWLRRTGVTLIIVFCLIQFLPYGWQRYNPPVVENAPWPTESSEALARNACYDCHSNETDWPVYAYVAPFSWLVIRDVQDGRDELNFSEWDDHQSEADDAAEAIADGSMPPSRYTMLHSDADLSDEEQQELIDALEQMDESR